MTGKFVLGADAWPEPPPPKAEPFKDLDDMLRYYGTIGVPVQIVSLEDL